MNLINLIDQIDHQRWGWKNHASYYVYTTFNLVLVILKGQLKKMIAALLKFSLLYRLLTLSVQAEKMQVFGSNWPN